jgi:histidine kinase
MNGGRRRIELLALAIPMLASAAGVALIFTASLRVVPVAARHTFVVRWYCYVAASSLLVLGAARMKLDPRRPATAFVKLLMLALAFHLVFDAVFGWIVLREPPALSFYRYEVMMSGAIIVLTRACVAWRLDLYARLQQARAARELSLSNIRLLDSQLRPHFVFNALNGTLGLADDAAAAQRLLRLLRRFLAESFDATPAMIPLRDELSILRCYTEIEQLRFGDALRIGIDADERALAHAVPRMLLQPLVENAIRHGGGQVGIAVRAGARDLTIRIDNRTVGSQDRAGEGIGMANARARLSALYGSRASLDIVRNPDQSASVEIIMPLSTEEPR